MSSSVFLKKIRVTVILIVLVIALLPQKLTSAHTSESDARSRGETQCDIFNEINPEYDWIVGLVTVDPLPVGESSTYIHKNVYACSSNNNSLVTKDSAFDFNIADTVNGVALPLYPAGSDITPKKITFLGGETLAPGQLGADSNKVQITVTKPGQYCSVSYFIPRIPAYDGASCFNVVQSTAWVHNVKWSDSTLASNGTTLDAGSHIPLTVIISNDTVGNQDTWGGNRTPWGFRAGIDVTKGGQYLKDGGGTKYFTGTAQSPYSHLNSLFIFTHANFQFEYHVSVFADILELTTMQNGNNLTDSVKIDGPSVASNNGFIINENDVPNDTEICFRAFTTASEGEVISSSPWQWQVTTDRKQTQEICYKVLSLYPS